MISKELLSKVLDFEISYIIDILDVFNRIEYGIIENDLVECKKINQYEFMYKCKEWAYNKGYMMKIENYYLNTIKIQIRKPIANSMYKEPWKKTFKNETEGIITACEWILKETK